MYVLASIGGFVVGMIIFFIGNYLLKIFLYKLYYFIGFIRSPKISSGEGVQEKYFINNKLTLPFYWSIFKHAMRQKYYSNSVSISNNYFEIKKHSFGGYPKLTIYKC